MSGGDMGRIAGLGQFRGQYNAALPEQLPPAASATAIIASPLEAILDRNITQDGLPTDSCAGSIR